MNCFAGIIGACLMSATKYFVSYEVLFVGRFIIGINCGMEIILFTNNIIIILDNNNVIYIILIKRKCVYVQCPTLMYSLVRQHLEAGFLNYYIFIFWFANVKISNSMFVTGFICIYFVFVDITPGEFSTEFGTCVNNIIM